MKLTAKYKGQVIRLNEDLIASRGLSKKQVKKILKVHKEKLKILHMMREWSIESFDFQYALRTMANNITDIEFKLQALWGFPQSREYHKFWELPQCGCPKMDNDDRYPSGIYVYSEGCPIHGRL